VVTIDNDLNKRLIDVCQNGFPNEVCGVLIGKLIFGKSTLDNIYNIIDFKVCENVNKDRAIDRFQIRPNDLESAREEAEAKKMDIIGVYHSHPSHPANASKTDKLYAALDYVYLIYSIYDNQYKELKGWVLNDQKDKMESVPVEIL